MNACIPALLALLAVPLSASAQSDAAFRTEWRPGGSLALMQEVGDTHSSIHEVNLGIRIPFLGGDADNRSSNDWSDLYSEAGFGILGSYSRLFRVSRIFSIGPYAAITTDFFDGERVDVLPGAGTLRLDLEDLAVTRLVFGVRAREQFGAFWMDQHLGFGPVFYGAGEAENPLDDDDDLEFLDPSVSLTFEVGFRFGMAVSRTVDIGLGMAFELNGAPDKGDDVPDDGFEFKGQGNFVLTIAVNLNF